VGVGVGVGFGVGFGFGFGFGAGAGAATGFGLGSGVIRTTGATRAAGTLVARTRVASEAWPVDGAVTRAVAWRR
jgi:hypothetical protein